VVGSYTVTAGLASDANFIGATSAPTAFTITKATQTITDLAGADSKTYGAVDYTLSVNQGASTSALTFTSSDTTVATISSSGLVSIKGAGTTTLTVNQAADGNYNAASAVTQTLTVGKAAQTITGLAATGSKTFGDADYTLSVNQGVSTSALTFTSSDTTVATISSSGLVSIKGAGTTTLTVNQAADGNYNAASAVTQTLTVGKLTPTISAAPTASAIGPTQPLSSSALSGGAASVPGSFAWTSGNNVPGVSGSYPVTFTPQDGANYNTASTTATLAVYDPDLPVLGADAFTAKLAAGMTTKVTLASLLANDRPSANPSDTRNMTFVSVESTSSGGAAIRVKGGWLIYQPSPSAQNGTSDTFTYTVSNGTKTATGTVTVSLAAPDYVAQVAIDRVSGDKVYFSVMPGMTFEVQGTSQLGTGATWTTIAGPNSGYWTSGADGRLIVTDPQAVLAPRRFYRLKWIP
jgi:hypothetical protein